MVECALEGIVPSERIVGAECAYDPRSGEICANALSVLVPLLEDVVGWDAARIRGLFAAQGLVLQEWDKARTDWVTLRQSSDVAPR